MNYRTAVLLVPILPSTG